MALFALSASLLFSGCSPGSLFGRNDNSSALTPSTQYRPLNRACTGINLSAPQMTGNELRSLVKCFNAYGALDPIQKLFDKLSDEQVNAVVQMANAHLLGDPGFLYDLERSFEDGKSTGALDAMMASVNRALENPALASSALSLLATDSDIDHQKILGLLQTLAAHMDPPSIENEMQLAMDFSSAKAFTSLEGEFASSRSGISDLKTLTDTYYSYLQMSESPDNVSLIDEISRDMQSGDAFKTLDSILGTDSEQIAANAPIISPIMPTMLANNGEILSGISSLFSALQTPIQCLKKTKEVRNPVLHMFAEISHTPDGGAADYIRRTHLMTMVALEPFCQFPEAADTEYKELVKLADSPASYGIERVVKASFADHPSRHSHPAVKLIEKFFLDEKTEQALPILEEITARGAWPDVILLLGLPGSDERAALASLLKTLTDPSSYLAGESAKDVLTEQLISAGPEKLLALASALRTYVNDPNPFVYPVLDGLRNNYFTDNAHPYIDFTRKLLADAPAQSLFFKTLFSVAGTPEFDRSLKLISTMAKDGRLKELMSDLITVFHGLAAQGQHPVSVDVALPYEPGRQHNLSVADLNLQAVPHVEPLDACSLLAPGMTLGDLRDPARFNRQWDEFLNCLTAKGNYEDVKNEVDLLRSRTAEDGQSELALGINLLTDLGDDLSQSELAYLGDVWVRTQDNGSFGNALSTMSDWIAKQVVKPLLNLAAPLLAQGPNFEAIEQFAARVLRRADFPSALKEVDRISRMKPDPETEISSKPHDLARIERWIENKECETLPSDPAAREAELRSRANALVTGYEDNPTSFSEVNGEPRKEWSFDDIRAYVEPGLEKFSNPAENNPDHPLLDALIDFLGYYSLGENQQPNAKQHFTPGYLAKWFYDRANDRKLITLYHLEDPTDDHPHVYYVDSLDRFEYVVLNADFDFDIPIFGFKAGMNLGKKALAQIGDSWGDEDPSIWPDDIKAKYANSYPPTLKETIEDLGQTLNWLEVAIGFPDLPGCTQQVDPTDPQDVQDAERSNHEPVCTRIGAIGDLPGIPGCLHLPDTTHFGLNIIKRRIYNLAQVYSVMLDNLPKSGTPQEGGMKVLRDLFYQLNRSTAPDYTGELDGIKNNLSMVAFVAGSGLDRQLAFDLRRYDLPLAQQFFGGLIALSQGPAARSFLQKILVDDPNHELIWSLAKGLYPNLGNPLPQGGPRMEALRMKQTLYYGFAALNQLRLFAPLDDALSSLLASDGNVAYFEAQLPTKMSNLSTVAASRLARALYVDSPGTGKKSLGAIAESALEDPALLQAAVPMMKLFDDGEQARVDLDRFRTRMDAIGRTDGNFGRELLDFFEERSTDPRAPSAARAVRGYLADRLEQGDVDQLLSAIAKDPAGFEGALDVFSKYVKNGDLKNFFGYLRRTMKPVN